VPMNQPDYEGAITYARERMEKELAPELQYHGVDHTFELVLPAAIRLAEQYDLNQEDVMMLEVAVAFHDFGWIDQGEEHEEFSVCTVREVLPSYGFQQAQIEQIACLIMATRTPQNPTNLMEQIIADADLDILGREDFWLRNEDLRAERSLNGRQMSDAEWYQLQLQFLETHHYHTDLARSLRDEGKQSHITELKRRLNQQG
jgi:uncharacterized protein